MVKLEYNAFIVLNMHFVVNRTDKNSTWRITKCRPNDRAIEAINHMFDHGGITINDWFSDKLKYKADFKVSPLIRRLVKKSSANYLFMAFNISIVTSTDRAMVIGWGSWNTWQSIPLKSSGLPMQLKWWVCKMIEDITKHSYLINSRKYIGHWE